MAQSIIVIGTFKMTDAWFQLSKEKQDQLMVQITAHREQVGVKNLVIGRALSSKGNRLIVDEYPDMESYLKLQELDDEVNWQRYWEGTHIVGTRFPL